MSSSTSSFSSRRRGVRQAIWIGLSLLLLFCVAEKGARKYARRREHNLSDPKDFTSIGPRAEQLMQEKGPKVVFVGNSAVQEGVDIPLFERLSRGQTSQARLSSSVHATMCAASDSQIKDWYWMMQHNYWQPKRHADLFVVLFFSGNMEDNPVPERGRLAQFFTSPRDWPEVFGSDVQTLGQRSDFLLSYASMLYAMRVVTQDKVLRVCAPGYQDYALQLNTIQQKQIMEKGISLEDISETPGKPHAATYQTLSRLLARAQQNHSKLCFIAYPRNGKQYSYKVSPEVIRLIRRAGMSFIDLRSVPELTPDKYRDSMHVNDLGRPLFTHRLVQSLTPVVSLLKPQ